MSFDVETAASQAAQQYEQAYYTHETVYEEVRNPYVGWAQPPTNPINNTNAGVADANEVGARWKGSARAATIDNITLSGEQTIDGVSVVAGNRVLVKNQTDGSENGIYDVSEDAWERSSDADTAEDLIHFAIYVREGETQADYSYTCVTSPITIDETPLVIEQFANRYSNQEVDDFLHGAEESFWEGIDNLKSTVEDWAQSFIEALDDAAEAVTIWYNDNIAEPWARGDSTIDSIARVVFGEVISSDDMTDGDEIPDDFDYENDDTRARTLFEWIDKVKTDAWGVAQWVWDQAKAAPKPIGPFFVWLEETISPAIQGAIEWMTSTLFAPYSRRDVDEPWDGFLDGLQRIIFGEVKIRESNGEDILVDGNRVDIKDDPLYDPTGENTRGRNFFEWWEDIAQPTGEQMLDWLWGGLKSLPKPIGPIFEWIEDALNETVQGAIVWTTDNIFAPYDRRDTTKLLDGFLDGIQRIVFGEVKTITTGSITRDVLKDGKRVDARSDPNYMATSDNTRGRDFFEWWEDVLAPGVQDVYDWIWAGLTSAPDPIGPFFEWLGTMVNGVLENVTKWGNRYLFGPYSRRTIKDGDALDGFFDGLNRILFGEVKTSDQSSFDPDDEDDGFTPTSANTRPRTFFEWWDVAVKPSVEDFVNWIKTGATTGWNLIIPELPEWDDKTTQWWDDAFAATWEALDDGAKAGLTAIKNLLFGGLIPQAYAEGAADNQITAGLKEETEEDGEVVKAGLIEARIRRDNAETINMMLPDDQKVTIPSEDSDEGILGALSEAVANFVAWISGSDDTVGLENLQQLEQKITWKLDSDSTVLNAGEVGVGVSAANELYFNVPTDKLFRFRINSNDRFTIDKDHVGTWKKILPEGTSGTLTLGDKDNRWHAIHTEALRLGGSAPDTKVNGMIWMGSDNNIKTRYKNNTVTLGATATVTALSDIGDVNSANAAAGLALLRKTKADDTVEWVGDKIGETYLDTALKGKINSLPKLLTEPITWSTQQDTTADDAKTGGSDTGNNIGFDNANDLYIKLANATSKMIIKARGSDLLEIDAGTDAIRKHTRGHILSHLDIFPDDDATFNLGSEDYKWNEAHTNKLKLYNADGLMAGAGSIKIGSNDAPFGIGYFNQLFVTPTGITGGQVTAPKFLVNGLLDDEGTSIDPPDDDIVNGLIWKKGSDVFVQTGGNKVDLSNIGGGSLLNLKGRITFDPDDHQIPNSAEVGIGPSDSKDLFLCAPEIVGVAFNASIFARIAGQNVLEVDSGGVSAGGLVRTKDLGTVSNPWRELFTTAIRFDGRPPTTKLNGMVWTDGTTLKYKANDVEQSLGGGSASLGSLSAPIIWQKDLTGTAATAKNLAQDKSGITLNANDHMLFRVEDDKYFTFTGNNKTFFQVGKGYMELNQTTDTALLNAGAFWKDGEGDVWVRTGRAVATSSKPQTIKSVNLTNIGGGSITNLESPITWFTPTTTAEMLRFAEGSTRSAQVFGGTDGSLTLAAKSGSFIKTRTNGGLLGPYFANNQLVFREKTGGVESNSIYKKGNDIYVHTGGASLNLSSLGAGLPGNLIPEFSTTAFTYDQMDKVFGSGQGAIGLLWTGQFTSGGLEYHLMVKSGGVWWSKLLFTNDDLLSPTLLRVTIPKKVVQSVSIGSEVTTITASHVATLGGFRDGMIWIGLAGFAQTPRLYVSRKNGNTFTTSTGEILTERLTSTDLINGNPYTEAPSAPYLWTVPITTIQRRDQTGAAFDAAFGSRIGTIGFNTVNSTLLLKTGGLKWHLG